MKVAILAGGVGSRLAESTEPIPKPMVEIGGKPLLWHIMKYYAHYGFTEFVVAAGYKSEVIKRYFVDYRMVKHDVRVHITTGEVEILGTANDDEWTLDIIDTGMWTETGGRVKRLAPYLGSGTFMLTFGDGVSDVDLGSLVEFHREQGKVATVTAVRPPPRFGEIQLEEEEVVGFSEKQMESGWINGGYMVLEPGVFDYIAGDHVPLYEEPMQALARDGELAAFLHEGFWQGMDTMREKSLLEELWNDGSAPWASWSRQ